MKEAWHKRIYIIWFCWYDTSRKSKKTNKPLDRAGWKWEVTADKNSKLLTRTTEFFGGDGNVLNEMWWLCNWTHLLKTIGLYAYNGWILWCINYISIKIKIPLKTEFLTVSYSILGIVHFFNLCDLGEMVNVYSLFSPNPYSVGYIGAIGLKQEWLCGMNEWLCGMNANPVVGDLVWSQLCLQLGGPQFPHL